MKCTLMHRELPVAVLGVNDISGTVYRVDEIFHSEHLPLGSLGRTKKETAMNLSTWLYKRMIPANRIGFHQAMQTTMLQKNTEVSASILLLKCHGLSLSDQYWLNPAAAPLQWKEINFYDNPFSDDVGDLLFGKVLGGDSLDLVSPCNTSDGWLKKKWKIADGRRVLIKGGSGMAQQEPFNEVVAPAVCRRLGIPHVDYSLLWEDGKPYSVCANMTSDRQDLVSAYALYTSAQKPDGTSAFDHFLARCEALGIHNARKFLSQMIVLDFLLCNQDRHMGNFGAIRDAVTLEWLGMAPVYDSGTSLWFDQYASQINPAADAVAKPFCATHAQQLQLVTNSLDWLDLSALDGLEDEVFAIFEQAHFGEPARAKVLSKALARRCELLRQLVS